MAYSNADEVKALFRDFPNTTDAAVDDTKINNFLNSMSNLVDARLKGFYQLPISYANNPISYSIISQIVAFKVAAIVDDILNTYSEADKKPIWDKKADQMLDDIAPKRNKDGGQPTPNNILPDATYLGSSNSSSTIKLSSTATPVFTKGGKNW